MIVHTEFKQGDPDWAIARAGIPTASEFDNLVTPLGKIRTGDMPKSYLAKKLAEKWLGGPLAEFNSWDMEQGSILENEAIPWFELEHDIPIERVGLVTTDDRLAGCSPDGLLHGRTSGIEIKCPRPETHVRYLLSGVLVADYAAQVHGSMFVTGAAQWLFLSYRRNMPPLLLAIQRDDKFISAIGQALADFQGAFDQGFKTLCELNGGPPRTALPSRRVASNGELVDELDVPIP